MDRSALFVPLLFAIFAQNLPAQPEWVPVDFLSGGGHQMVYDDARERLVVFGGSMNGPAMDQTWERNGVGWALRDPVVRPPARGGHAMAYDSARGRVVLFGGQGSQGRLSDTWEWDGTTWTEMASTASPSARLGHAMAYDAVRQRVLLFGGCVGSPDHDTGDTWEWDGSEWTLLDPQSSPSRRCAPEMAYDKDRQVVVLFGGQHQVSGGSQNQTDTWEWDGTTWTEKPTSTQPLFVGSMAYDSLRKRVVLYRPGFQSLGNSETWEWDGTDWTELLPFQSPQAGAAMAFDAARGQTVFLAGSDGVPTRTWAWDGADWTPITPVLAPVGHVAHDMTYDSNRERVVMFAGQDLIGAPTGTWEWDGRVWTLHQPMVSPKGRRAHAMAYDSARKVVVLYGGDGGSRETWEWDGAVWTPRFSANSPPHLVLHTMAYDAARQRTVLFGGQDLLSGNDLAETWEWDGIDWLQRTPATSPTGRGYSRMAYDVARQRVVLFGGLAINGLLGDTWEWDGSGWSQLTPPTSPSARGFHAMAYNSDRQRVVLFGGASKDNPLLTETWEWDGSTWSQLHTATSPLGRQDTAMSYDMARKRMVLYGGSGSILDVQRTWLLGETVPDAAEVYGTGCPGSHGTPHLEGFGKPSLGNKSFALDLSSMRPGAPALLAVSTGSASQQFGACTLLVDPLPAISLPVMGNGAGFASVRLPVPEIPNMIGLELYAQGIVFDPAGSFASLAVSNGLMLRVGE